MDSRYDVFEGILTMMNIYQSIITCQNNIIELYPTCEKPINVTSKITDSLIIENGSGYVEINGKFNHLYILRCQNLSVRINDSCIAGIDVLSSRQVNVSGRIDGWFNTEFSSDINLDRIRDITFEICPELTWSVTSCLSIKYNGIDLNVNPWLSFRRVF